MRPKPLFFPVALLVAALALALPAHAIEDSRPTTMPQNPVFAQRAQKAFDDTKARYKADPTNNEAAWQFARATYDLAEFAKTGSQREAIAEQGIEACRAIILRDPQNPQGHYYLALNLGQDARDRSLGALKLVSQMQGEFMTVLTLDPRFDYAGADRGLGLLYFETPGWPLSIGSKTKARVHLQKADKMFPNYPENRLNIIEAYIKWGDRNSAIREMKQLDALWPDARKELTGVQWESSWADWANRRETFQKKLQAGNPRGF